MLRFLNKIVTYIENTAMLVAAISLMLLVFVQAYNVVMRYLFKSSLAWTYPFITNYLLVILFFFALSWTFREGGHIKLDVLSQHFNKRVANLVDIITDMLAFLLFMAIAYLGSVRSLDVFLSYDISPDSLQWPVWTAYIIVPIGSAIICIRLVHDILAKVFPQQ